MRGWRRQALRTARRTRASPISSCARGSTTSPSRASYTLAAGNYADITVFDYAGVKVDPAVPDFTPQGIKHVYVNGTAAVKDGSYLTQRAGKLILKK